MHFSQTPINRDQIEMIALDQLIPAEHLVRKMEADLDFLFVDPLVESMYSSERGRPSIDPVVLIKWHSSNTLVFGQ